MQTANSDDRPNLLQLADLAIKIELITVNFQS